MKSRSQFTLALLAALTLAVGCGGDEEAQIEPDPEQATGGGGGVEEPENPSVGSRGQVEGEVGPTATDPSFELRATAGGPYTAGEPSTFQIRLSPRGVYHVNEDYPMHIALSGEGVTLPESLEVDDASEHSEQVASFEVPFTASAAGEHTVTAEVDFAVCTPEACMPETRTLALVVAVQ